MIQVSDPQKIRILLIDDHALFREGVTRLLAVEPDLEMTAHCGSVEEGQRAMASGPVDIVLLDPDLGQKRGSEFLVWARENGFKGPVLILTAGVTEREMRLLLQYGASGVILKHSSAELLSQSIRETMKGKAWLDERYAPIVAAVVSREHEPKKKLTDREREVLRAVFEGLANKEIAQRLLISESSVKAALQQLFEKAGVRTRSQLVRIALKEYSDQL